MTGIGASHDDDSRESDARNSRLEQNLKSRSTWVRLLYMALFGFLLWIAGFVLFAVVIIQFVWRIVETKSNERLLQLGRSLARYFEEVIRFLTFNTEELPFPIDRDWPGSDLGE